MNPPQINEKGKIEYRFILKSQPSEYNFNSVYRIKTINIDGKDINIEGVLYVGNPKSGDTNEACVTITVSYPEGIEIFEQKYNMKSPVDSSVASLILTKYYTKCSENKDLIQGEGTVEMLNTAMGFIKQTCKFVKEFDLKDSSSKKCDNNTTISLPYFYIMNKGKTWYEAKFGAYLKPRELYDEYKQAIRDMLSRPLEDFSIFSIRYLKQTPETVCKSLGEVYIKSKSMGDFTDKLYKKYGMKMGCILLQSWIDEYMRSIKLYNYILYQHWYISINSIPSIEFLNNNKTLRVKRRKQNTRKQTIWNNNKK